MENNKTFLQVWDDVINNHDLDVSEVLIISKIMSFINANLPCYVSNEDICNLLRLGDIETASRRLSKLQKKGYIKMHYTPHPKNPNKTRRYITLTYENGLIQKSSRVDPKVKGGLIQESRGVDFEVKGVLTFESRVGCLESQSIISLDKNTYKNTLKDNLLNKELNKQNSFEKEHILSLLKERFEGSLATDIKTLVESGKDWLTPKQKDNLNENRDLIIKKLPILEKYLN